MTVSRLRQHHHRAWFAALVVPLLCLRAVVPTGFMPELGADGWITLQLCTAQGLEPRRIQIDTLSAAKNSLGRDPAPHTDRSDCVYAVTAGASPIAHAPALPAFVAIAVLAATPHVAPATAAGPLARSQSARGPPAYVG